MGNIGRLVCVALPFVMTVASIVAFLIGGLGGVADKNMYMFSVNTSNLTISENTLASMVGRSLPISAREITSGTFDTAAKDAAAKAKETLDKATGAGKEELDKLKGEVFGQGGTVLKAADMGLAADYTLSLWGFCYHSTAGAERICSQPSINWASKEFNGTAANLESIGTLTGHKLKLPAEVKKSLEAFGTLIRVTQIVFIAACILLGVELLLGLFTSCSRVMSCLTWIVAGLAATAVVATAALATAMSAAVVGSIEGSAKVYGARAAFNTSFLAAMWIAAALAIGAASFWVFTICCCAPEKRPHRRAGPAGGDSEKFLSRSAYAPLHDPEHNGVHVKKPEQMSQYGAGPRQTGGRSDLAYEPYSNQPYTGAH